MKRQEIRVCSECFQPLPPIVGRGRPRKTCPEGTCTAERKSFVDSTRKNRLRRERREDGLCYHCPTPAADGHILCTRHLEDSRRYRWARRTQEAGE